MKPPFLCPACAIPVSAAGATCHRCQSKAESKAIFRTSCYLMLAVFGWIAFANSCKASVVTEEFLDRVAWIESRNNPNAVGKAGERSTYQLTPKAVEHVRTTRGWKHSFSEATKRHARAYARAYLILCEQVTARRIKRQPTQDEVYRAYNRGPYSRGLR